MKVCVGTSKQFSKPAYTLFVLLAQKAVLQESNLPTLVLFGSVDRNHMKWA